MGKRARRAELRKTYPSWRWREGGGQAGTEERVVRGSEEGGGPVEDERSRWALPLGVGMVKRCGIGSWTGDTREWQWRGGVVYRTKRRSHLCA